MTILVRDEIDIIKDMIDFHLAQGVDHIIITDNGSVDGTYEACKEYTNTGKVELLEEPASDFSQHRWVTRMANIAYEKYNADWVINADADEFFLPLKKNVNLKDTLKRVKSNISALRLPRHDFVSNERAMKVSPSVEMIYRKTVSLNFKGSLLPPKVIHRGSPNTVIPQGNHDAPH